MTPPKESGGIVGWSVKCGMNDKLLSFLGIARRAGRLSLGFDAAADMMKKGRSRLLILSADLSENTSRSILREAQRTNTKAIVSNRTIAELGAAVGKAVGIISVNDEGFAKKIDSMLQLEPISDRIAEN